MKTKSKETDLVGWLIKFGFGCLIVAVLFTFYICVELNSIVCFLTMPIWAGAFAFCLACLKNKHEQTIGKRSDWDCDWSLEDADDE